MNYEEKLKLAKEALASGFYDKKTIEYIFPELRESKDEKIRRAIIEFFKLQDDNTTYSFVPKKDILAWLEKQGEQENLCNKCRKEQPSHSCQDITALERCALEKQKERAPKIIIPKFHIGEYIKPTPYNEKHLIKSINEKGYVLDFDFVVPFKDEDVWELVEQKTITWSEDDENYYQNCLKAMRTYSGKDTPVSKWIESLKDRVQPQAKQEWSEEDNKMLNNVIQRIKGLGYYWNKPTDEKMIDWLTSLRPQSHWKPSEEQMRAMFDASERNDKLGSVLRNLYDDLRKI